MPWMATFVFLDLAIVLLALQRPRTGRLNFLVMLNRSHTKVHIKKKSRFYGTFLEFLLFVNNVLLLKLLAASKQIVVKVKRSVVDHFLLNCEIKIRRKGLGIREPTGTIRKKS